MILSAEIADIFLAMIKTKDTTSLQLIFLWFWFVNAKPNDGKV